MTLTLRRSNTKLFSVACQWYLKCVLVLTLLDVVKGIVGGEYAAEGEFPYAVSIMTELKKNLCAGVLLNYKTVLTACQCVAEFHNNGSVALVRDPDYFQLIAGTLQSEVGSNVDLEYIQYRSADLLISHPKCAKRVWYYVYDYAIFRVASSFYRTPLLQPMPFLETERLTILLLQFVSREQVCTTVGWGQTKITFSNTYTMQSVFLKKVQVQIVDWGLCGSELCRAPRRVCDQELLGTGKICARTLGRGDSCQNDEGGPLVCEGIVFALACAGVSCGEYPFKPRIYSRIDFAMDFIIEIAGKSHHNSGSIGIITTVLLFKFTVFLVMNN